MKLLIVTQYFWPEFFIISRLAQKIHESGHAVTVLTGKPNYPEGEIYPGYTASGLQFEDYDGIELIRVPVLPRKKGALGLIKNYFSFVFSSTWNMFRLLKGRKFDAVLVYVPSPITSAIPAVLMKRRLNAHLAVWVQDLWPQSLSATGYVKNKWILKIVGYMVRWIYNRTDTLLAQSHAFEREIEKYVSKDKIVYYPNSIEPPVMQPLLKPIFNADFFGVGFSIIFAGNIGTAQSIPTLIAAAKILSDTECQLIIVGEGSMLEWAKDEVARLNLSNVHFTGKVDNKFMPWIYSNSDVLLVSLTGEEIFSYTLPGKLQACLAAGKPIVSSVNGEVAEVIKESGAGIACPAENPAELAKSILKIHNMDEPQRVELGMNGVKYFKKHFDMNIQSEHLINILEQRIKANI